MAQPAPPPTAYGRFKSSIEFAALDCDTGSRTARVRLEFNAGSGRRAETAAWTKCVSAAKSAARRALLPALAQFDGHPTAQGLLRAYHARWLDHIGTTGLELSLSDSSRSLRIEASGVAVEQARRAFESEAGLD